LADAIGAKLGTGGHLAALVRTRSGEFTMAQTVGLDVLDRQPQEAAARVVPLRRLLTSLPAVTLTAAGASLAARGGFIGPAHVAGGAALPGGKGGNSCRVRLLHPDGHLVAVAEPRRGGVQGLLHPTVVLE
jgi:tRNA U55 pseudouridine synthase TruB